MTPKLYFEGKTMEYSENPSTQLTLVLTSDLPLKHYLKLGYNIINTHLICPPIHFNILYGLVYWLSKDGQHYNSVLRAHHHNHVYPMANDV